MLTLKLPRTTPARWPGENQTDEAVGGDSHSALLVCVIKMVTSEWIPNL